MFKDKQEPVFSICVLFLFFFYLLSCAEFMISFIRVKINLHTHTHTNQPFICVTSQSVTDAATGEGYSKAWPDIYHVYIIVKLHTYCIFSSRVFSYVLFTINDTFGKRKCYCDCSCSVYGHIHKHRVEDLSLNLFLIL